MNWNKTKQQLETFRHPGLTSRVEYSATSYRYTPGQKGQCYLTVDKNKICNMIDQTSGIRWFESEQEIKSDASLYMPVSQEDCEAVRRRMGDKIPEERLVIIARDRKLAQYAKEMLAAQESLAKSDFLSVANQFLTQPIEESLSSPSILLNVLSLIDRRMGKKRLRDLEKVMPFKHPLIRYFYQLRQSIM